MATITWKNDVSGDFADGADWIGGVAPASGDIADLNAAGAAFTVTSSGAVTIAGLDTAANAIVDISAGTFASGSITNAGEVELADGATLASHGTVSGAGVLILNGGSQTTEWMLQSATTLKGGGQIEGVGNGVAIVGPSASTALVNFSDTISGSGYIGADGLVFTNAAAGVIDSDNSYNLTIDTGSATFSNAGLAELTGRGEFTVVGPVYNSGTLDSHGIGELQLYGGVDNVGLIEGNVALGNVDNAGTMATNHGNIYVAGSVTGDGQMLINGAQVSLEAGFTGQVSFTSAPGTLQMAHSDLFDGTVSGFSTAGASVFDLLDVIYGSKSAWNYSGSAASGVLTVTDGTHTASLRLVGNYTSADFNLSQGYAGSTVVTASLLDPWATATSGNFATAADWNTGIAPGALDIAEIEASGTYTVTASASQTVHSLTVSNGGDLAITAGTFSTTPGGGAGDELSVVAGSSIILSSGAVLQLPSGNVALSGEITIDAGGEMLLAGPDTASALFTGGGTITLGGAGAQIDIGPASGSNEPTYFSSYVTIVGGGQIICNRFLQLQNGGLVEADMPGSPLAVGPPSGNSSAIDNYGALEATNGGELDIQSGVSGAGLIQAEGAASVVDLTGGIVSGGSVAATDGGSVEINGASLAGVRMSTSGGGVIEVRVGTIVFAGNVNLGAVDIDDGVDLLLRTSLSNSGGIAAQSAGSATIELQTTFDGQGEGSLSARTFTLVGAGSITLSDNAGNSIGAQSSDDIFDNDGNVISGAGQIGGGSGMIIMNDGLIDATGVNALIINVATGKVTNQVHGVLEGSGVGGLSFTGGTLNNSGTVSALDGSSVTFGSGSVIANSVDGVLTGGHWFVTDSGDGAEISLSGSAITTLAGLVELSGANSAFSAGGASLEDSLTTITSAGKLELLAGRSWSGGTSLTDDGLLQLTGGTFDGPGLTVGASGKVSAVGTIASPTEVDGLVQAYRGPLDLAGAVTGTGALKIFGSSSLTLGNSVAASVDVLFGTGTHEVLKLAEPLAFASTLNNWSYGDTIDLAGTDVASAAITGDTLAIGIEGGGTLDYSLANPPTGVRIVLASDGAGGTNITLFKATSAALLSQGMAAMRSPEAAGSEHAAPIAHRADPLMALTRHA